MPGEAAAARTHGSATSEMEIPLATGEYVFLDDVPDVPPLPTKPARRGLPGDVAYAAIVGRGWLARWRAERRMRAALAVEQAELDGILGTMGRVARDERIAVEGCEKELAAADDAEVRAARVRSDERATRDSVAEELAALDRHEAERRERVAEAQAAVDEADRALRAAADAERESRTNALRLDGEGEALEGDEGAASERAALAARLVDAEAERARRETLRDAASALRDRARAALVARRRELDEIEVRRAELRRSSEEAMALHADEVRQAEAAAARALVAVGTVVSLQRPDAARLRPLYERVDETKGRVVEREALIGRLASERHEFDVGAVERGLATVGCLLGALAIGAVLAILLLGS